MATIYKDTANGLALLSSGNGHISFDTVKLRAADEDRDEALGLEPITIYEPNTVLILVNGEYEPVTASHLVAPVTPGLATKLAVLLNRSAPSDALAIVRLAEVNGSQLKFAASSLGTATPAQVAPFLAVQHVVVR